MNKHEGNGVVDLSPKLCLFITFFIRDYKLFKTWETLKNANMITTKNFVAFYLTVKFSR